MVTAGAPKDLQTEANIDLNKQMMGAQGASRRLKHLKRSALNVDMQGVGQKCGHAPGDMSPTPFISRPKLATALGPDSCS
jgi:hypothetical protein